MSQRGESQLEKTQTNNSLVESFRLRIEQEETEVTETRHQLHEFSLILRPLSREDELCGPQRV